MKVGEKGYVFRGATVCDGSGSPPVQSDVAVSGDRIAAVAPRIDAAGACHVDARGLILAPGFIDIHSHSDLTLLRRPMLESKVFQGVTAEVIGNCGISVFPASPGREWETARFLRLHQVIDDALDPFADLAAYAGQVDRCGLGANVAPLIGHCTLRIAAMGTDDRPPAPEESERMQDLLAVALEQGAWGMSTGLIYPPGSHAAIDELVLLAKRVAERGGLFASHIRNEGDSLLESLEEAIRIGRESSVRVQVSHLKAMGRDNWGKGHSALVALAAARREGVDIAADQYPYDASSTTLSALLPRSALAGGAGEMLQRLRSTDARGAIESEIAAAISRRGGPERIVVIALRSEGNAPLSGKKLSDIALLWSTGPETAVSRLLMEEEGSVNAIFFSMAEEDVDTIIADPFVAVGSDGHGLNASDDAGEATHPRSYGTFARVLGRYVRQKKILALPEAIRKMTWLPASRLGFADRGLIRPGFAADVVLFDPEKIADQADYTSSNRYSTGVVHLLVNGRPVLWEGKLTGDRPGRVLRKGREGKYGY